MKFAIIVIAVPVIMGCGTAPFSSLNDPDSLTLYSIDGRDEEKRLIGVKTTPTESFRGYPVLGKIQIEDRDLRRKLIASLKDAYRRRPEYGAKCFWPRHAIRAVEGGKAVDIVVCFECSWFSEYLGDIQPQKQPLNRDVQPIFDQPLTGAGIEFAPK